MKNDYAIIKSDLTPSQKDAAEYLVDEYRNQKGSSIIKAIKTCRKNMVAQGWNITERDLQDACAFHNVLNEYASTI